MAPKQNWQAATIVTDTARVVFDWKKEYAGNWQEAWDYMMFYDKIAKRDAWRIVRGSI